MWNLLKLLVVLIISLSSFLCCHGTSVESVTYFNGMYSNFSVLGSKANTCVERPCKNGATCSDNTITKYRCQCTYGWKGKNCDIVTKCSPNPCQYGAPCVEDENSDDFTCICPADKKGKTCKFESHPLCFYPNRRLEKLCFRPCIDDKDCEKHQICSEVTYKKLNGCFDKCNTSYDCENTHDCYGYQGNNYCHWRDCFNAHSNCDCRSTCHKVNYLMWNQKVEKETCFRPCDCGDNGTCRYEKNVKICDCDPGFAEKHGQCIECDCGNKGTCKFENCQKKCYCYPGFIENNGKCTACHCGNKGSCRFEKGQKICDCNLGFKESNGICKACDCGHDGACRFERGHKKCDCKQGYSEADGKCLACICGPHGACRYEGDHKTCECEQGYSEADGTCLECDCGRESNCSWRGSTHKGFQKVCHCKSLYKEENGLCVACICKGGKCVIEGGNFVCKCAPGYGNFTNESCKACDCGPDANCIWEARFGGNKICLCKPGYSTRKGKCAACECGPDSNCEWISEGWLKPEKKVCFCKPGYHDENGKCVDNQARKISQICIPYKIFP